MPKTVLITGSTDGIGLEAAKGLAARGHQVLLHGRNPVKLEAAKELVGAAEPSDEATAVAGFVADLSRLSDVEAMAEAVIAQHDSLDVLINNAGVFQASDTTTTYGIDLRFVVNTIAPYLLTKRLLPMLDGTGRVVNLSSAAQQPVDPRTLATDLQLPDFEAYAQSKLALTMWSRDLAHKLGTDGPMVVAVNPGSLLATKMVKEGFGVAGNDIGIGADILIRAALSDEFAGRSGSYFDNDSGRFAPPHADGLDQHKIEEVVAGIEQALAAA